MTRKVSRKKFEKEQFMEYALENNVVAITQGPRKKSWNLLDIKSVKPLNDNQRSMVESFYTGNNIVAAGSVGTGKTFLALWLALNSILDKDAPQRELIIVRSIVQVRDIGYLKGSNEEKLAPYEVPYRDIIGDLMGKHSAYDDMVAANIVKFVPTSFVRGQTWDNAIIVVDEFQSMTFHEISSVITRLGHNSKIVICGDTRQTDNLKNEKSGYADFVKVAKIMKSFDIINFTRDDIVRSKFVKSFICACEDLGL